MLKMLGTVTIAGLPIASHSPKPLWHGHTKLRVSCVPHVSTECGRPGRHDSTVFPPVREQLDPLTGMPLRSGAEGEVACSNSHEE